jgi:biotin carboxyl carrier protein
MNSNYTVIVNGETNYDFTGKDIEKLDVATLNDNKIHILHNQKSFSVELLETDFLKRNYTVKVNGNNYKINIETELDHLIKKLGLSLGNASVEDEINAPMPGLILEVNISEGDTVKKGDFLCVLEAMKMENTLTAPRDGTIKSVNIAKGETVDKGMLLIELEKND